jgi:hypothetical protein
LPSASPPVRRRSSGHSVMLPSWYIAHSLLTSECSMVRMLMRLQHSVRTQNDPAASWKKTMPHSPSCTQPGSHRLTHAIRSYWQKHAPRSHRMPEPERNIEIPLLQLPPDSQENYIPG